MFIINFGILWLFLFSSCQGQFMRISDVQCSAPDETISKITKCLVKQTSKTNSEVTLNMTLLEEIKNVSVRLQFGKKSINRYNPYFHGELKLNACKFLENPGISPIANYIYTSFKSYSNMNHTCPYKDYVTIDRYQSSFDIFKYIPVPSGDYSLATQWVGNGKNLANFTIFLTYSEN